MASTAEEIGQRIRRLRTDKGMTQLELAAPLYTAAHVCTVEQGRRRPSETAIKHFATKLGVDIDEIASGRPSGLAQELRLKLNQARVGLSGPDRADALKTIRLVRSEAKRFSLLRIEARAIELQALAAEQSGDHEEALRTYEEAERVLREESPTSRAYPVAGRVRCLQELGDLHHAIYVGEMYLEELSRTGARAPDAVLKVLSPLVYAYHGAGAFAKADEGAAECLRLTARVRDPLTLAGSFVNVAAAQFAMGQFEDADASLAKAEDHYEQLRLQNEQGLVHLARGCALSRHGSTKLARQQLHIAESLLEESGNLVHQANAHLEIGRVERLEGQHQLAIELITQGLDQIGPDGPLRLRAWGRRELGLALMNVNKKRGEKELREAIDLFAQGDQNLEVARTYLLLAEAQSNRKGLVSAAESSVAALQALEEVHHI